MGKTLAEMTAEVMANNKAHGWHDEPRSFGDDLALLHSEVSEALEAYRDHGLEDATRNPEPGNTPLPKPEGVGSELADVLIRLLDTTGRYEIDLHREAFETLGDAGPPPLPPLEESSFGADLTALHYAISKAFEWKHSLGDIFLAPTYLLLLTIAERYGVDLEAEYERKHAFNLTRPFKHGNRIL